MIVSTTSSLDGYKVTNYIGPVTAQVVVGSGFIKDIFADISDFFGARSGSYQKKLKEINDAVINSIKEEAEKLGADAIIGLKIDNGDISGSGRSMFMVTAVGTAVKTKPLLNEFTDEELLTLYTTSRNSEIHKELLLRKFPQENIDAHLKKIELEKEALLEQQKEIATQKRATQNIVISEIRADLESKKVRYIECKSCGCKNYTSSIEKYSCNQCGSDIKNGTYSYY